MGMGDSEPVPMIGQVYDKYCVKPKPKISNSQRRLKSTKSTNVSKFLDERAEKVHKKLNMDNLTKEQMAAMKEVGLDLLQKAGVIKSYVSQKKRRKEINKNNKKLIEALKDDKILNFEQQKEPKTRQSRSQTILLAQNYGGDKF